MSEATHDWSRTPDLRELAVAAVESEEGVFNSAALDAALEDVQELVRDLAATVKANPPPPGPDRVLAAQLVERAEQMLDGLLLC